MWQLKNILELLRCTISWKDWKERDEKSVRVAALLFLECHVTVSVTSVATK